MMSKKTVEIKLGNVVYQVEREFVGTVSQEELLVSQLIEKNREKRHQLCLVTIERVEKDG